MDEFEKWLERHKQLLFRPDQYTLASVKDAWNDSEPHWREQERKRIVGMIREQATKYAVMGNPLDSIYKSDALYELADRIEGKDG